MSSGTGNLSPKCPRLPVPEDTPLMEWLKASQRDALMVNLCGDPPARQRSSTRIGSHPAPSACSQTQRASAPNPRSGWLQWSLTAASMGPPEIVISRTRCGDVVIDLRPDGMCSGQWTREGDAGAGNLCAGSVRMSERRRDGNRCSTEPSD
jgi:hypothetical protein